ncbi:uncharacterized protein DUF4190 [Solirubrobacter pauli]|uniref:Uncharacterized protein DUF4190 n=1 Tax=Solirubrobacter pauli TaxID=166793 RepID=A0A660L0Z9_9ACTN|nr:DUF4190 domain-containing protein [Solirubrobacter pauli]RKQ87617.1 uncharacterized protein DUF4190 [Solirubrobacter pauli]
MAASPEAPERPATTASSQYQPAPPVSDHQEPAARGGNDGRAVAAMILGIIAIPLGLLAPILGIVPALVALVLGLVAKNDIRRTGKGGYGQAKAGFILGIIAVAICILNAIAGAIIMSS